MEKMVKKNEEYVVDIIDNGYEGEGIAKINNFTIFIPNAIKKEKVKILIVKVLSSHAFGKVIQILEPSNKRVKQIDCDTYVRCGGCNLRHVKYEHTLEMKRNMVQNLVNKSLKQKIKVDDVIGMKNPYNYRNKAQIPMGINSQGKNIIGIYAKRSHEIIPINKCYINDEESLEIVEYIYQYIKKIKLEAYDERTGKGIFRHIVMKKGFKTNEIMCILVINTKSFNKEEELAKELKDKFPNIKSIVKNINMKNTNVILGKENINLYGDGYIYDKLDNYTFKISPMSFYQINPIQTEKLYSLAIKEANITKGMIAFDLYCGIGTISIFLANRVKKVYGIEIVQEAIKDANENAKLNNIENIEFISGDVEKELEKLVEKKIIPDVIFVDPPRKGLDNTSIANIQKVKPKKLIYISCNPATLVRDLQKLEEKYIINKIMLVDMFPYTHHIECVSLLGLKK